MQILPPHHYYSSSFFFHSVAPIRPPILGPFDRITVSLFNNIDCFPNGVLFSSLLLLAGMTTEVLISPNNNNPNPPNNAGILPPRLLNGIAAAGNGGLNTQQQTVAHGGAEEGSNRSSVSVDEGDQHHQFTGSSPQRLVMIGGGGADQPHRVSYHCAGGGTLGRKSLDGGPDAEDRQDSPRPIRSPRCEAFVMTGDKMLSLNPKISPCYAKMRQNQLPPAVEVDDPSSCCPPVPRGLFDDFPSVHRVSGRRRLQAASAVPGSQSEDVLNTVAEHGGRSEDHPVDGQRVVENGRNGENRVEMTRQTNEAENNGTGGAIEKFMASQQPSQSTPATPARGNNSKSNQSTSHPMMEDAAEAEATAAATSNGSNKQGRDGRASNRSSDLVMVASSSNGHVLPYTPDTVARLARHLFNHNEGIRIAAFLVKNDDLSLRIVHEFLSLFNFAGLRIDAALRAFLHHVSLTGETSERAQLLAHFAQKYQESNPTVFNSADEVQALACALLLLNRDIHGKNHCASGKKMSSREFIDNLAHTEYKYDKAMLKELYAAVKGHPFQGAAGISAEREDEEEEQQQSTSTTVVRQSKKREKRFSRMLSVGGGSKRVAASSAVGQSSEMVDPEQQVDYKHGWLLKKSLYDADGKRTPLGRRKWQMHYGTIRGMALYLHQNEHSFSSAPSRYITFRNCILLHHAMAEPSRDYAKRRNVFQLRTAQLGELLFQTSEPDEVRRWCDAVNYVAAAFSTPALPTPVAANGLVGFYKPHLPSTPTHLSIHDQFRAHEQRLEDTMAGLARLREQAPPMKARGRVVHEYFYKERYLETEKDRYAAYVAILRDKLARSSSSVLHYGDSLSSNNNGRKTIFSASNGANSTNFEVCANRLIGYSEREGKIVESSQQAGDGQQNVVGKLEQFNY